MNSLISLSILLVVTLRNKITTSSLTKHQIVFNKIVKYINIYHVCRSLRLGSEKRQLNCLQVSSSFFIQLNQLEVVSSAERRMWWLGTVFKASLQEKPKRALPFRARDTLGLPPLGAGLRDTCFASSITCNTIRSC